MRPTAKKAKYMIAALHSNALINGGKENETDFKLFIPISTRSNRTRRRKTVFRRSLAFINRKFAETVGNPLVGVNRHVAKWIVIHET